MVAYWGTADRPSYLHLRFLHDGYDFSAAQFFSAQREAMVLAGVNFATDGGDRHVSLDRIKDATIRAKDLRLRLEFGGAAGQGELKAPARLTDPVAVTFGDVTVNLRVPFARLGEAEGHWEAAGDQSTRWLDVVFHHGEEKTIRLSDLAVAAVALAVQLTAADTAAPQEEARLGEARLSVEWGALRLDLPVRPDKAATLQATSRAE
jgi:hypothetical protein